MYINEDSEGAMPQIELEKLFVFISNKSCYIQAVLSVYLHPLFTP